MAAATTRTSGDVVIVGEPAAVIAGWEATVIGVALRDYQKRHGFVRLPADQCVAIDRVIGELEEVGRRWRAGMVSSGQEGSEPAPPSGMSDIGLSSASPRLLRTDEVAKILGVSVSTVKRMVVDGTSGLPAVKVGGRSIRFRRSDVEDLMKATRNGDR